MIANLPRNSTIPIPIDVSLFEGTSPLTGEAAYMSLRVVCLDNGHTLDNADGIFRLSPATPIASMTPFADYPYDYQKITTQDNWPRGNYRGIVRHFSTGREWQFDFTLGLVVHRQLGYSAVYDGTNLNLSVWVEEDGVVQTDFVSLNNCKVVDCTGHDVTAGNFGTNNVPFDGVFNFQKPIALSPVTNYIFKCDAVVPGPSGRPDYVFPLRVGLARP